jgi:hypothetical protein
MIQLRRITLALAALAILAVGTPAYALDNNYHHVIRECYDSGRLDGSKYTREALKKARKRLPSDIKEYSDCEDLINEALANYGRGGGPGSNYAPPPDPALTTPSGAIASSKEDFDALGRETKATVNGAPPQIPIANQKLTPTTGGVINSAAQTDANDVPLPLILALAALAAMALIGAASVFRQRWPQTRLVALRLLRR